MGYNALTGMETDTDNAPPRPLGYYGNPVDTGQARISDSNVPPQYEANDTYKLDNTQIPTDAFIEEYGILTSIVSGSGLKGSLKLRTFCRKGQESVTAYQLFEFVESDEVIIGTGNSLYEFQFVENPERANFLLQQNPDLVNNTLEGHKTTH